MLRGCFFLLFFIYTYKTHLGKGWLHVQVFFFAFFYLHPQDALWRGLVARAGVFFVFIPDLKMGLFCGVIFEFLFLGCELRTEYVVYLFNNELLGLIISGT